MDHLSVHELKHLIAFARPDAALTGEEQKHDLIRIALEIKVSRRRSREEELNAMPVKALKEIATKLSSSITGLREKSEIVAHIVESEENSFREEWLAALRRSTNNNGKGEKTPTEGSTNDPPRARAEITPEQAELVARILSRDSHFEILGLEHRARHTDEDVKKAYRNIALKIHPDKCPDPRAPEAFKRSAIAFQSIKTSELRASYIRTSHGGTGKFSFRNPGHGHHDDDDDDDDEDEDDEDEDDYGFGYRHGFASEAEMFAHFFASHFFRGRHGFDFEAEYYYDDDDDEFFDEDVDVSVLFGGEPVIRDEEGCYVCESCDVRVHGMISMMQHLRGKRHATRKAEAREEEEEDDDDEEDSAEDVSERFDNHPVFYYASLNEFTCDECDVYAPTEEQMWIHLRGNKHKRAMEKLRKESAEGEEEKKKETPVRDEEMDVSREFRGHPVFLRNDGSTKTYTCRACDVRAPNVTQMTFHLDGKRHAMAMKVYNTTKQAPDRGREPVDEGSVPQSFRPNTTDKNHDPRPYAAQPSADIPHRSQPPQHEVRNDPPFPRRYAFTILSHRVGILIGTGGSQVRSLQERTGAHIYVNRAVVNGWQTVYVTVESQQQLAALWNEIVRIVGARNVTPFVPVFQ